MLTNRGYNGELTIDLAPNDTPTTGPVCLENCKKCLSNNNLNQSSVIHASVNDGGDSGNESIINKSTTKTISGKFFMVNGANISCACVRSPNGFSKYCHLGDGYIDLVLVRHTSFINNLRFLLAMSSQHSNIVSIFSFALISPWGGCSCNRNNTNCRSLG